MRNESTKVSRSSQQIAIVRRNRDSILPEEPRLSPLVPERPAEEGTLVERRRSVVYWLSPRETTRR